MKIKTLTKGEVEKNPNLIWDAFVGLVALEKYDDLAEEQRAAHLVFWYDSEVYNGGHLQYFANRGTRYLPETIVALQDLGVECQRLILCEAAELFLSRERAPIQTVQDFSSAAMEGEFSSLDSRFYACVPSLYKYLQTYLARHPSSFVIIT